MYPSLKNIFVTMAFIWLTATTSADPDKAFIDHELSLRIGQSITFARGRLVIKFKAVLEDSRCPTNVVCVWAGNGKVKLEILDIDGKNKAVILNTEDEPTTTILKGHILKLIALNPPRVDGVSISPKDYIITLRVERKSSD